MMKKYLFAVLLAGAFSNAGAQSVAINTDGTVVSDAKAMVEIKKPGYSKLKIRSTSLSDTSVLELSNRNLAGTIGTDFLFSHIRENALVISTRSDLAANSVDSIMTITPQGIVRFRSLRGTANRMITADANGEISATSLITTTHYLSIPASGFQPRYNSSVTNFTSMDANSMASFTAGTSNYLVAPVNLPNGAVITSFKVYYVDNSATDIFFTLYTTGLTSTSVSSMTSLVSTGASGSISTISFLESTAISFSTIDNLNSSYFVLAGPPGGCCWDGSNLRIKGVVITYTL